MGSIKGRDGMAPTEAGDIKKGWQEHTEELCEKGLHDPDSHSGVTTHPEPDILGCGVKWVLGSITMNKASGGDGIPVEIFQILKNDVVKVLHSVCQQNSAVATGLGRSVFIPIPKKSDARESLYYCTIALISHASKAMLKILQVRLQQHVN